MDDSTVPNGADPGSELQAVLFDMDGTLVDTEPYWIRAEYELVECYGGTWTDEDAHALVGSALTTSAAYIREHGAVPLEPDQIVDRLIGEVIRATREAMPWRPGARSLLAELGERHVPLALVTMSYRSLAQELVDQLPAGTFGAVVAGDDVTLGKPHPEAYLTAARRLGAEPRRCVAIEDSPTGVAAAEAAGCVVVAIPHHVPIPAAPGRVRVDSLRELDAATLHRLVTDRLDRTA